ncbi:hypothetical protein Acj9p223 [Acinetobacter phage Acj9]|uniref:Uncharacterized protein n=1 Tax=Acinetobacter phage Acj9 TaxID=760939 RepID=E5EQ07_9CAUD|nr:hypothetical protein Acj9p223 [Acinetobacter phage Acj9]ADG60123.1 hypothetical protein Acj9p223 [Acinetobacter phage Acj9]
MDKALVVSILALCYMTYQMGVMSERLDKQTAMVWEQHLEIADLRLKVKTIVAPEPKIINVPRAKLNLKLFTTE